MAQKKEIDALWFKDTLTDAAETLSHAINLIEEDPRRAEGVLEHEITELYAKLHYAVNTARIGPDAYLTEDHDKLIRWPKGMPFTRRRKS